LLAGLKLPALVVGRPGLGTINHSLLTIKALQGRGVTVAGFCFSGSSPEPSDEGGLAQNAGIITGFSGAPFWGSLPYVDKAAHDRPDPRRLAELAREHLDLSLVFSWLA